MCTLCFKYCRLFNTRMSYWFTVQVCSETSLSYCEYSCDIDNGGCGDGRLCIEVDVPSCIDSECCSPVNVTCEGNYVSCDCNASMYIHTYMSHTYVHIIVRKCGNTE